jgi:flagellar biosynthesis/type III secretory pathway M-ring protein FliF/YscJ
MPDNVQQILKQLRTLFNQLSKQQKLSLAALAIAVLVPMLWVTMRGSTEERIPLQWGARFDRDSLRQAEQTLIDQGHKDFTTVGETILVKRENVEVYNAALASGGIWSAQAVDEWQKMFENINIFTPREQLKEMRNAHLRREIRRVISAIETIQDADVIWAESSSLSRWNRTNVTCSVAITTRAKHKLTPGLIESLQTTVASMIPNLEPKGVVIIDRRSGQSWSGGEASVAELRSLAKRQALIDSLQAKIRNALSFVPDAIVSASVEFALPKEPQSRINDPNPDSIQENKTAVSAIPTSLHVTVSLPDEYFVDVANAQQIRKHQSKSASVNNTDNNQKNADLSPSRISEIQTEEISKIETICARLLPAGFGADDVTVTTFTPLVTDRVIASSALDIAWLSSVWPIALVVVVVIAFSIWWATIRRSKIRSKQINELEGTPNVADVTNQSSEPSPWTGTMPIESETESGIDLTEPAIQELSAEEVALQRLPFDFLQQSNSDDVYFLLADENPQTIAIALSHVSTQMATDVLSSFPESQQLDIVRRIANSAGSNCEYIDELAESLETKSRVRIDLEQPQFAKQNKSKSRVDSWRISSIEQLAELESTVLATLIRKVPRAQMGIAISGLTHEKRSQILLHLPHHVSKDIREHIAKQGELTRPDIERAQQDVLKRIGVNPIPGTDRNSSSREFVA